MPTPYPVFRPDKPRLYGLQVAVLLLGLLIPGWSALAQHSTASDASSRDTLSATRSAPTAWVAPPPTGRAQKTQGILFMAAGTISALSGVINMNREDPCADFNDSPYVDCLSNVEDVRTVGKAMVGMGGALFAFGLLRYGYGVRKARIYRAWQRQNGVLAAEAAGTWDGVHVKLTYRF